MKIDFGGTTQTKWTIIFSLILVAFLGFQLVKTGSVQPELASLVKDTLMVMWGVLGVRNSVKEKGKNDNRSSDLIG